MKTSLNGSCFRDHKSSEIFCCSSQLRFFKGYAVAKKGVRGSDMNNSGCINAPCFYATKNKCNEQNSFTNKIFFLINSNSQEDY